MKKILIAVDFSDVTPKVLKEGLDFAKKYEAKVLLLHTEVLRIEQMPHDARFFPSGFYMNTNNLLDGSAAEKWDKDKHELEILKEIFEKENIEIEIKLIDGDPTTRIYEEAKNVDLVIIGNHYHGKLHEFLFKDVSNEIINRVKCPILVVPSGK